MIKRLIYIPLLFIIFLCLLIGLILDCPVWICTGKAPCFMWSYDAMDKLDKWIKQ